MTMTLTPYQVLTKEVVFILKLGLKIKTSFKSTLHWRKHTHLELKIHMQKLQAPGGPTEAVPDPDFSSTTHLPPRGGEDTLPQ